MERYRTVWRRISAALIDTVFFAPALYVGVTYYRHSFGTAIGYAWAIGMFIAASGFSVYFHGRYGATPGKSLMRCRVVTSAEEEKISFRVAFIRESPWIALGIIGAFEDNWAKVRMPQVAVAIGYATSVWFLSDMLVAVFHPKRRALHDLIAGTVVVRKEPNKAPEPTPGLVTPRALE